MTPSMNMVRRTILAAAGAALVSVGCVGLAAAADPFYKGKTVELITPYPPGGSQDLTARFLAPLLSKYVEGNPAVQVINMPGSESIVGGNEYESRNRDGLTWFQAGSTTFFQDFLGNKNAKFKLSSWLPLVGFPQGSVNYGSKSLGIKDVCELRDAKEPLFLAAQGTDGSSILRILSLHMLGVEYKLIPGYEGAGTKRTALLQGEITINGEGTTSYNKSVRPEAEAGNVVALYSYGFPNDQGGLDRDPGATDFPTVAEAYECLNGGKKLEGRLFDIYKTLIPAQSNLQRALFMHRNDPPEAISAVQAGVAAMMASPEWKEGMETVFEGYPPFTEGLEARLSVITNPDPAALTNLEAWLAEIGFPRQK